MSSMEKTNLLHELSIRKIDDKLNWLQIGLEGSRIPPLYKAFHNTYNVESYNSENSYSVYLKSENRPFNFGAYVFNFGDRDVGLGNFIHPKDVSRIMNEVLDEENKADKIVLDSEMMPFGITNFNEFILVGIGVNNLDRIFIQDNTYQEVHLISIDAFEFCRKIDLIPESKSYIKEHSRLYKNWGENYWRKHEGDL